MSDERDGTENGGRSDARAVLVVLGLLAVVALAGCAGLGGGDGAPERTPYEVSPRSLDAGDVGPPGVAGDGVESLFALLQSHVGVLTLDSFEVVRERTVRTDDGRTLRTTRVEARMSRDRQQFLVATDRRRPQRGERDRRAVYASVDAPAGETADAVRQAAVLSARFDGDDLVAASRVEPTYGAVVTPRQVLGAGPDYRERLYRYLAVVETATVTRPEQRAGDAYRIEATRVGDASGLAPGADRVSNVSVNALVTPRGLLARTTVGYTAHRDGERRQVRETIVFRTLEAGAVDRPGWFEAALATVEDDANATTPVERAGRP